MSAEKEYNYWHRGFYGGIEYDLRDYLDILDFSNDTTLGKEPPETDLVIVKKVADRNIENDIGSFFDRYNILEYKSPDDSLTIKELYKTYGYTFFYMDQTKDADVGNTTVTLVRDRFPKKLFYSLKAMGISLEERCPGIYQISGELGLRTQIVVTSKMLKGHSILRILRSKADEEEVYLYVEEIEKYQNDQRMNANLHVIFMS